MMFLFARAVRKERSQDTEGGFDGCALGKGANKLSMGLVGKEWAGKRVIRKHDIKVLFVVAHHDVVRGFELFDQPGF